jgi:nucleoid DNA-binding protein
MLRKKHDLDQLVADEMGIGLRRVREITTLFLAKVAEALVEGDTVVLMSFGRFLLKKGKAGNSRVQNLAARPVKGQKAKTSDAFKVTRIFRIHFKKSTTINRMLTDKYGPGGHKEKK